MRLVVLLNAYWLKSGADLRALQLCCRWARDGHEVHVIAPRSAEEAVPDWERTAGRVHFHWTEEGARPSLLVSYWRRLAHAHRLLRQFHEKWGNDFVLYSATDAFPDVMPATRARRRWGILWIACCYHIVEHWRTRPGNWIWNALSYYSQRLSIRDLRTADGVVVDNQEVRAALVACGLRASTIFVRSCGVEVPAAVDFPDSGYDLSFCGRVKPSKGIHEFVDLLKDLRAAAPADSRPVRVGIVGGREEAYAQSVEAACAAGGLSENLKLLGPLPEDEKSAVVGGSKVFVSLSHEEGWGMAVAEAMALGIPVVAYDLPCYREVFPGLLRSVPVGDTAAIAREVSILLTDPALRRNEGMRAREYIAAHYSYEAIASSELELFKKVLRCDESHAFRRPSSLTRLASLFVKLAVWGPRAIVPYLRKKRRERALRQLIRKNLAAHRATVPQRGITFIAPFTYAWSLSKMARDFARRLKEAGLPYQTLNVASVDPAVNASDYEGLLTPWAEFDARRYDHVVELFSTDLAREFPARRARIAFWEAEHGLLNAYPALAGEAAVVAMSDFNARCFRAELPPSTPVKKLLYPLWPLPETGVDRASARRSFGLADDDFVVFSNFDISSCERKNPRGMIRAFAKAFSDAPRAKLVFKVNCALEHPRRLAALQNLARELGVAERFICVTRYLSQSDLYSLTAAGDVYLSLNRGEGFGLGIAEAMQLGCPVVVTDFGAPLEFCAPEHALLIPHQMVPIAGNASFAGVDRWPSPDEDAAAHAMRRCFDDPAWAREMGARGRAFVMRHFSTENFRASLEAFLDS